MSLNLLSDGVSATPRGLVMVMVAAVLWGTTGVASSVLYGLAATNPLSLSCFRLMIAAPLLTIACVQRVGWRQMLAVSRRDFIFMLLMGVLIAAYQALYFLAIPRAGIAISTLVTIGSAPVLVALFTSVIERKPLTRMTLFAISAALIGTFLLVGIRSDSDKTGVDLLIGVIYALGSGCGTAGVILSGRFLANRIPPLQVTAVGFSTGAVILFIVAQITGFAVIYPAQGWLLIAYLGIFPTAFAYGLFMTGMRSTPAVVASVIALLEPLVASLLAWLIFGEQLTIFGLIGGGLLLLAIYILAHEQTA